MTKRDARAQRRDLKTRLRRCYVPPKPKDSSLRQRSELKARLRRQGLTIAEASRLAGLSYQSLERMLNGRARPTLRVMVGLADALEENPARLFGNEYRRAIEATAARAKSA